MKAKNTFWIVLIGLACFALIGAVIPPLLRERIAIYAREDSWIASGSDIIWYTGNLSGETHRVDGAGGVRVVAPTAVGTATPALVVDSSAAGSNLLEVRDAGTPVWTINNGGAVVQAGSSTFTGGQTFNNWVKVSAPTAIATATPAAVFDSVGVSNLLEVRDAATPVLSINNGGNWTTTGGHTQSNWAIVSAPTAIATATPAMVIDSLGVSNLFEVRDAATPVVSVNNGGAVNLTQSLNQTQVNAAGGSANPYDFTGTLGIMNGSDDFTLFDVNVTNADHTSTVNTVQILDVANITGDADATESAIKVGTGWDVALDANSGVTIDGGLTNIGTGYYSNADGDNDLGVAGDVEVEGGMYLAGAVAMTQTNAAGGSANPFDYSATLGIMDGSDDFTLFDVNITNADHTGASNTVQAIDVANITGDADATETAIKVGTGWDIGLDVNSAATIDGGLTNIGGGTYTTADGDNDLGIDGDLEVNGASDLDSTLSVAGAATFATDVTVSPVTDGGNAGAKSEISGLPRIKLVGGAQGTNPASQTIDLVDDSPTGEFAPVDASVTEAEGSAAGIFKVGASSYAATFAADAAEDDGFVDAGLGASAAWDDMESFGAWVYITATVASGDLQLVLTDDGGARKFNLPAVTSANTWTWIEVDISTGDLSAISDVAITLTSGGATNLGIFTIYLDEAWVWDSADEEALGTAILQDGVLSVIDSEAGTTLTEWTDYLVHYEDGNDFLVYITNQSAADVFALVAY